MDLVDEQDVAFAHSHECGGEITGACDHRCRNRAELDAEFFRDDPGECRLSETGRAMEDDVVHRILAMLRRRQEDRQVVRSEEHTSELQSLMRTSYAVFCLKNKKQYHARNTFY